MKDILKITVSLDGRILGALQMTPERDRCVFEYDKNWIASGFSISPWELPLRTGLIYSKDNSFGGGFAAFEDSMPDGYGLYLLDRMLRREGSSLGGLSPLQRLSIVGSSGMGALCYRPEAFKEHTAAITDNDFDELQRKALDVLSEKSDADASFLYYNSRNSGGARPKAVYRAADGSGWIVKFRHIYDPSDIGKTEVCADTIFRFILNPLHDISWNIARNTIARVSSEQNTSIFSMKKMMMMKTHQTLTD